MITTVSVANAALRAVKTASYRRSSRSQTCVLTAAPAVRRRSRAEMAKALCTVLEGIRAT